jgi:L-threonylcarbamoyladenylate synthase
MIQKSAILKAAGVIREGGLVAFPTETVYGLGASALNKKAVKKIFKAKKRPAGNPLIVHIADVNDLSTLAKNIPKEARILAKNFWPGPLTIILNKKKIVPKEITAGGNTVAIRVPNHTIALELIKRAGVPIAAPSANLSGKPSPTSAKHVFEDLGQSVDLILNGGRTKIGIESTVVDLTVKPPLVLRPGGLTMEKLRKILKDVQLLPGLSGAPSREKIKRGIAKSPGMKYRHYAPSARLILVSAGNMTKKIQGLIKKYKKQNKKTGVLCSFETKRFYGRADAVLCLGSKENLKTAARNLFKILRGFDKKKVDVIFAESFPQKDIGFAIADRLKRASDKNYRTR